MLEGNAKLRTPIEIFTTRCQSPGCQEIRDFRSSVRDVPERRFLLSIEGLGQRRVSDTKQPRRATPNTSQDLHFAKTGARGGRIRLPSKPKLHTINGTRISRQNYHREGLMLDSKGIECLCRIQSNSPVTGPPQNFHDDDDELPSRISIRGGPPAKLNVRRCIKPRKRE